MCPVASNSLYVCACKYIRVGVNLCCQFWLLQHTIGPFISQSLPSALYQTSVWEEKGVWVSVCVRFWNVVCVMYVLLCVPLLLHPPVECVSVRALVIVSDRAWCREWAGTWHILGSVPMRAAWSSKQPRMEPLNQSVSLTTTWCSPVTATLSPISLTVQCDSHLTGSVLFLHV